MKRVGKPVFFIVAFIILFLTFTAIFGIHMQNGDNRSTAIKGAGDIRWGIDIRGGVEATFSPDVKAGTTITKTQLDAAKSIIELRLVNGNITDYEIYPDYTKNRVIVRFPWKNDEKNFDPETAIKELSATAKLTFREGDSYTTTGTDANGNTIYKTPKGDTATNIVLDGSDIKKATAGLAPDSTTNYEVELELNSSGNAKFASETQKMLGKVISIWMDDVRISNPKVDSVISNGKCSITGTFTATEASALASKINAGALPFTLKTSNFSSINPTLGSTSLKAMLNAGIIAFILICLFMLFVFRLPGFVAVIALAGQVGLSFAAVSGYFPAFPSFTMTLPGIAGIILSIGMGVDANIITACRIKEELWAGKTLDGAIQKGDDNSFWAIFDGNITVIIVALILMGVFGPSNILSIFFGASTTGAIYSFGFTLLIGVIGNFLMGVTATRLMTKSLSNFTLFRKKWLYGGAKE